MVVYRGDAAGRNICLAYHSVAYVTQTLAKDFSLAQFIESTGGQDFYLLQKRAGVKDHTR